MAVHDGRGGLRMPKIAVVLVAVANPRWKPGAPHARNATKYGGGAGRDAMPNARLGFGWDARRAPSLRPVDATGAVARCVGHSDRIGGGGLAVQVGAGGRRLGVQVAAHLRHVGPKFGAGRNQGGGQGIHTPAQQQRHLHAAQADSGTDDGDGLRAHEKIAPRWRRA